MKLIVEGGGGSRWHVVGEREDGSQVVGTLVFQYDPLDCVVYLDDADLATAV